MNTETKQSPPGTRLLSIICIALLAGCGKEEIKVYSVPKETAHKPMMAAIQSEQPDVPVNSAPIQWKTPSDWKELPPNSIRIGNFSVEGKKGKKAEVAITSFPGSVGTELDNWNRWRRELGLGPTEENEIASTDTTVGTAAAKLYNISSDTAQTIVAALSRDGASWFFKLRGDKEVVSNARPTFIEFLKTIRFEAPVQGLPEGHPPVAAKPVSANAKKIPDAHETSGEPKFDVPAGWKEQQPGMMVFKAFAVRDENGHEAKVTVSSAGGDLLANVNRWRGQLSLEPIAETDLPRQTTSIDVLGGKATLVDMKGTDAKTGKPTRMIAAVVPHGDTSWFYKLVGDETAVEHAKPAFVRFVETVRYPND